MKASIIAEIGSNWEGKISSAKKIIKECKDAGADGVKFQMWRAEDLYSKKIPEWDNIKKSELNFEKAKIIKKYSDSIGIEFFCSVFYPEAVDFMESLKIKKYKIASRTSIKKDFNSNDTLKKIALTKKSVIISMGMGGNKKTIKNIFKNNNKLFCYCIAEYPLDFNKINWKDAIKYDGFSDHTLGITAPIIFTILKKQKNIKKILIEKHVKLKNSKGPDASTSIDTEQLKKMISDIRIIEKMKL
jgi:N,N'-diacetyllegionaminate synthase